MTIEKLLEHAIANEPVDFKAALKEELTARATTLLGEAARVGSLSEAAENLGYTKED